MDVCFLEKSDELIVNHCLFVLGLYAVPNGSHLELRQ